MAPSSSESLSIITVSMNGLLLLAHGQNGASWKDSDVRRRLVACDHYELFIQVERSKTTRVAKLITHCDVTVATQIIYCDVTQTHHHVNTMFIYIDEKQLPCALDIL